MKTILTLGVGFWLGRELYLKYDKKATYRKRQQISKRLEVFLKSNGFNEQQQKVYSKEIIGF